MGFLKWLGERFSTGIAKVVCGLILVSTEAGLVYAILNRANLLQMNWADKTLVIFVIVLASFLALATLFFLYQWVREITNKPRKIWFEYTLEPTQCYLEPVQSHSNFQHSVYWMPFTAFGLPDEDLPQMVDFHYVTFYFPYPRKVSTYKFEYLNKSGEVSVDKVCGGIPESDCQNSHGISFFTQEPIQQDRIKATVWFDD